MGIIFRRQFDRCMNLHFKRDVGLVSQIEKSEFQQYLKLGKISYEGYLKQEQIQKIEGANEGVPGEKIEELSVKRKKKKKVKKKERKPRKKKISRLTTVSNRADLGGKKKKHTQSKRERF